ncbi:oxidoreductase [Actinocrispum sp. NPDC049592]|uniref:WD40/YVTN/BNR-like repeat-containing protein n=1 Tax=Actinocrispum sp. NPDC049592 TaxID=3154835 RepID=UPI0034487952
MGVLVAVLALLIGATPANATNGLSWQLTPTGSAARLRGLSVVDGRTAWASGSLGTVLRTTDGGRTWQSVGPPDTADLQFRDIEAFDADHAVILSIGNGAASRIYVTANGGKTWQETFRNPDEPAFYDCVAFFDRRNGLAMSDPVDGKFRIIATSDGGASWKVLPSDGMPPAQTGEAGFAASGQCLITKGSKDAWIGSGGGAKARVYHSRDRGRTWTFSETPLGSSESSGVFALAFRNTHTGIAIGGDFNDPDPAVHALATTRDGGRSWREPPQAPRRYRSGATYLPYLPTGIIAVGPSGSDLSWDDGNHWHQFDEGSFDTVDCGWDGACWASGEKGRIAKLRW